MPVHSDFYLLTSVFHIPRRYQGRSPCLVKLDELRRYGTEAVLGLKPALHPAPCASDDVMFSACTQTQLLPHGECAHLPPRFLELFCDLWRIWQQAPEADVVRVSFIVPSERESQVLCWIASV